MATKRVPIKRGHTRRITPELRAQIARLAELNADHMTAIRGKDAAFYSDGRHEELVDLAEQVHPLLGIRPWDDDEAILAEALA